MKKQRQMIGRHFNDAFKMDGALRPATKYTQAVFANGTSFGPMLFNYKNKLTVNKQNCKMVNSEPVGESLRRVSTKMSEKPFIFTFAGNPWLAKVDGFLLFNRTQSTI